MLLDVPAMMKCIIKEWRISVQSLICIFPPVVQSQSCLQGAEPWFKRTERMAVVTEHKKFHVRAALYRQLEVAVKCKFPTLPYTTSAILAFMCIGIVYLPLAYIL